MINILRTTIALLAVILTGCQVKPQELVDAFFTEVANKNLIQAGVYCTESFRSGLSNMPSALKSFNYGIKKINWNFRNLRTNQKGMTAEIYVIAEREWPAPNKQDAVLLMDLVEQHGKWYISSVQVVASHYTEFTTNPVNNKRFYLFALGKPKWKVERHINNPLDGFLKSYDKYCYSWLH